MYRDWRFGALMPAEIMGPLAWDALDPEEQRLVAALMRFPGGEARESQLLPGLGWTSERLYAVAAPRARQSAEFCCCLYAGETFRLTDQARDCFLAVNEQEPAE